MVARDTDNMKGLGSVLVLCLLLSIGRSKDHHRHWRQVPLSHSVINKSDNGSLNLDPEIERKINHAYLTEFFEELT